MRGYWKDHAATQTAISAGTHTQNLQGETCAISACVLSSAKANHSNQIIPLGIKTGIPLQRLKVQVQYFAGCALPGSQNRLGSAWQDIQWVLRSAVSLQAGLGLETWAILMSGAASG